MKRERVKTKIDLFEILFSLLILIPTLGQVALGMCGAIFLPTFIENEFGAIFVGVLLWLYTSFSILLAIGLSMICVKSLLGEKITLGGDD